MANTTLVKILSGETLPRIPPTKDPELDKYFRDVNSYLRRLAGLFTTQNVVADPALRNEEINGFIEAPLAKSYTLDEYAEYDYHVTRITHKLVSGGCTIAVKINGITVAGTGDSTPSSVQGVLTFTSTKVSVGQRLTLVVSSISTPVDLAFTLKRVRDNG